MQKVIFRNKHIYKYVQLYNRQYLQCSPSVVPARSISFSGVRNVSKAKWVMPHFQELKKRHDKMTEKGLVPEDRRSTYIEWNLESELYAFGKRLNEEFDRKELLKALMDRSHLVHQEHQQRELGLSPTLTHPSKDYELTTSIDRECNEALAAEGLKLVRSVCHDFVTSAWPSLPLEAVKSVVAYLCSDDTLQQVAQGIGLKDLIFAEPFPPSEAVMSRAACAVMAVLAHTSGQDRASAFVVDMVATHLVGKSLWDMWQVDDPLLLLSTLMEKSGDAVEPRLVHAAGRNTLEAAYQVALYDRNKTFLSSGYGETVETAASEAARDALCRIFGSTCSAAPLPFTPSLPPTHGNIPHYPDHSVDAPTNPPIEKWTPESADPRCGNIVTC